MSVDTDGGSVDGPGLERSWAGAGDAAATRFPHRGVASGGSQGALLSGWSQSKRLSSAHPPTRQTHDS